MNLNQVTIPTRDLKTAITFYEQLGLRLIIESAPRYARFECPEGEATFSLHLVQELPKGEGAIIYFETAELDKKVEVLKKKGLVFLHDPIDQSWLWREARLADPDGNIIILYNAGKNRKFPPWRIS